jgi:hypothetical protein
MDMSEDKEDAAWKRPYEVGYRKPPKEHQFKPGHTLSKGRPRGSRNTKALLVEDWHRLRHGLVNGKRRRVSRSQKGTNQVTAKASDGDLRALDIVMKAEAELAEKAAARESGSQFSEPADDLAMADIVRRLRALPLLEQGPPTANPHERDEAARFENAEPASAGTPTEISPAPSVKSDPNGEVDDG